MTLGAESLLEKWGTRIGVAEALILGHIASYQEKYATELVNIVVLEAAKFRIKEGLTSLKAKKKPKVKKAKRA